jgi:hypothetical protein
MVGPRRWVQIAPHEDLTEGKETDGADYFPPAARAVAFA